MSLLGTKSTAEIKDIVTEDLLTTEDFIRVFSARTGYNLGDSKEILDAFRDIFSSAMLNRNEIKIPYFLHLSHTLISPRIGSKPSKGKKGFSEKVELKESTRSNIKLAKNLRALSKSEIIETQEE